MKIAFPTDEHHPFADQGARSVALKIVRDFAPDVTVAGSDGIDFYGISRFDKNPARMKANGLQTEIDAWAAGQREWISAASSSAFFYIPGNHEDRLEKYLWRHPELHGLNALALPNLLGLDGLGVLHQGFEHGEIRYTGRELEIARVLVVRHGTVARKHSGYTAKAELENEFYSRSTLTGHNHRGGSHYATTRDGLVQGHESFCLCSLEPEYVEGLPNWQHGIVLATVTQGVIGVELVPFSRIEGKTAAIWRGELYREE